jgi:superfamily II DNA/RNA helicase
VAIADHAGSGKTLAYLLPFVQSLKKLEAAQEGKHGFAQPKRPGYVVVCPTEELCKQVVMVCRGIAKVRFLHPYFCKLAVQALPYVLMITLCVFFCSKAG